MEQTGKSREKDFTKAGLRLEGAFENDRNQDSRQLFKDILRECFCEEHHTDFGTIIGHHLSYEAHYKEGGFAYTLVQEIPSADALIFDHDIMKKVFPDNWKWYVKLLAVTPTNERDAKLAELYYGRKENQEDKLIGD